MIGLLLFGISYLILKGETNIEITNKNKNKKYTFYSKDFKCSYKKEDVYEND